MTHLRFLAVLLTSGLVLLIGVLSYSGDEPPPKTGPQTEKRFPPLQLPAGFKATLFACDPLIEYPSVIAIGPKPGSLFVAVDFMTGLGTEIVRRDEVRLIEDTDADGYADKATVLADGFNSIQGLAYHDGTVYVMHAPYLTSVRVPKGAGKATDRRDLLTGLGLPPEKDQIRLHNANGVVVGHDGWLYLAMGDRGCDVTRPEGDRLIFEGGGVLRCRPDGRDLHVFASGLRNIYDVSLDEDLNVFVRDNENDGGDYKIRICHSFFGADHGYPYLYHERPDEALPPLADLGLGSSAGGVCYLETQFPTEYLGNLFFCEWGRAVVRAQPKRSGATFTPLKETDFAAGAANDPYGFKPTDLVVDRDGSLLVSDWADGQRPRRGRGRIYQIKYVGEGGEKPTPDKDKNPIAQLDAISSFERRQAQEVREKRGPEGLAEVVEALEKKRLGVRGRLHAVWIVAKLDRVAVDKLFALLKSDPEPRVQVQAANAIADLTDPVLVKHRLDSGPGDAAIAERLAALAVDREPSVMLAVVIALGRLRYAETPAWLTKNLKQPDSALGQAAMMALRRSGNWSAVLNLLDAPSTDPLRSMALRAVAEQYDAAVVDGLAERLKKEPDATRRREYADLLTRVWKKPATPWTYWGFRPPPRPANTVAWDRTEAIEQALQRVLADQDPNVRLTVLRRMLREKVPTPTEALGRWLKEEREAERVASILTALRDRPAGESRSHLEDVIRDPEQTTANRLLAVSLFITGLDASSEGRLLAIAEAVKEGPVLAELLRAFGKSKPKPGAPLLLAKLSSSDAEVRAAAVAALTEINVTEAHEPVRKLLDDSDARVRAAAALAAGKFMLRPAADQLLKLAKDSDAEVRRSSLEALRCLREPKASAVAAAALGDRETSLKALECLGDLGGVEHIDAVVELARREPSVETLAAVGKVVNGWAKKETERQRIEKAQAEIHGSSGVLLSWHVRGPMDSVEARDLLAKLTVNQGVPTGQSPGAGWRLALAAALDARLTLGLATKGDDSWLGYTEIHSTDEAKVEFMTASTGLETVCLNGREVFRRDKPGVIGPYPDRFEATLAKGANQVVVLLTAAKDKAEWQLRFRRKSAAAGQERLALAALSRAGNPEKGRQLFLNAEKSLCVKCHRVGDQGERVGPELTGLGSRFSKVSIVESILEPSRAVSPSFETTAVTLKTGKVVTGVKVVETESSVTLVDNQAQKHVLALTDVDEQRKQPLSSMPDGVEKRLTEDEFVDLISFLVNLKETRGK